MKTRFLITFLLLIFTTNLFSQINTNPNDNFYKDLYLWENRGLIENLPPFKPYPIPVIKSLLSKIIEKGNSDDKKLAQIYLDRVKTSASFKSEVELYSGSVDNGYLFNTMLETQGLIEDFYSFGINGGSYYTSDENSISTLPLFTTRGLDYNTDTSNLGPFELMSTWSSVAAVGYDKVWLQTGLAKSSYGPFIDSNVINSPTSPQSGYFTLVINLGNVIYTKEFHQVSATDSKGEGQYNEKFYTSNGFQWQALPWFNIGIFDLVVYGERFDALYLLPFTQLMYAQGFNGFADSSMIGVTGTINLPKNFNFKGIFFVDDFHFNDTMKLNFDTKYKFGFESRLNWTPEESPLKIIELGYTLITPHMYTHEPEGYHTADGTILYNYTDEIEENINYTSFTNKGESIGSNLLPNSDQIRLTTNIKLPFGIDMDLFGNFIRNANSSTSIPSTYDGMDIVWLNDTEYFIDLNGDGSHTTAESETDYDGDGVIDAEEPLFLGDGSLNDHGVVIVDRYGETQNHWEYSWIQSFPFLKQDNINYTTQLGLSLSKDWMLSYLDLSVTLNYTFQQYNSVSDHFLNLSTVVKF